MREQAGAPSGTRLDVSDAAGGMISSAACFGGS